MFYLPLSLFVIMKIACLHTHLDSKGRVCLVDGFFHLWRAFFCLAVSQCLMWTCHHFFVVVCVKPVYLKSDLGVVFCSVSNHPVSLSLSPTLPLSPFTFIFRHPWRCFLICPRPKQSFTVQLSTDCCLLLEMPEGGGPPARSDCRHRCIWWREDVTFRQEDDSTTIAQRRTGRFVWFQSENTLPGDQYVLIGNDHSEGNMYLVCCRWPNRQRLPCGAKSRWLQRSNPQRLASKVLHQRVFVQIL